MSTQDGLLSVADVLHRVHDPDADDALLVRVALEPADVRLALLPLPDGHPLDLLLGSVTPDEWDAVGVVVTGRVQQLDGTVGPPERIRRCSAVVLVDRAGGVASVVGSDLRSWHPGPGHPDAPGGRVVDALRRSLGLATSPPAEPVAVLMSLVWLHRVHAVALDGRHPDAEVVAALRPHPVRSWTRLRHECVADLWPELECPPDLAAWMDDGMFARWCRAAMPEPALLVADLAEVVGDEAARRVVERARPVGVPGGWG